MNIVFVSHTAQTGVFRVGSHHLARELSRQGHVVAHVSTPVTIAHAAQIANNDVRRRLGLALRPRRDEEGVYHVVAIAPLPLGRARRAVARVNEKICATALLSALRAAAVGRIDAVVIDQPLMTNVAAALDPTMVVYRPTDVHLYEPLATAEAQAVQICDKVVATSQTVLVSLRDLGSRPRIVLENGVEYGRFVDMRRGRGTGVVYVGALDQRFDWRALIAMAKGAPDAPFHLVGPVSTSPPNLPRNVRVVGPMPYRDIPEVLKAASVGILPLKELPENDSRSPMKYYEYLAAGLRVVARHTRTLASRTAPGVALYQDDCGASVAVRRALSEETPNIAGMRAAELYDWSTRARVFAEFIMDDAHHGACA